MPRTRRATEVYINLTARISQPMMEQIERYLDHVRQEYAAFGLDRSAAIRMIVSKGLDAVGFPVPPDGPSGLHTDQQVRHDNAAAYGREGPATAVEGPSADHAKAGEDQLLPLADLTLTIADLAPIVADQSAEQEDHQDS